MSKAAAEWQSIETCPKETDVLLFNELWDQTFGAIQIGAIDHGGEWNFHTEMSLDGCVDDFDDVGLSEDAFEPTHWMPLPSWPDAALTAPAAKAPAVSEADTVRVDLGYEINEALSNFLYASKSNKPSSEEKLRQILWDNKAGIIAYLLSGQSAAQGGGTESDGGDLSSLPSGKSDPVVRTGSRPSDPPSQEASATVAERPEGRT